MHRKVGNDYAEYAVRKCPGDDPEVTNGCEIHVRVERSEYNEIRFICGLDIAKAAGHESIVLVPGSIGETGFKRHFNIEGYQIIQMSNFVGFMLDESIKRGFKSIIIGGHPGKLLKLIRGDFYTHSSSSKPANDVLIGILKKEKLGFPLINMLNKSPTIEGMVEILREHNLLHLFNRISDDVQSAAVQYVSSKARIGVILFDMKKNVIGYSKGFTDWQKRLKIKLL